MNSKIKQLAHRAGFIHDIDCGYWIFNGEPVNTEVNTFAELIIKECLEKGDTVMNHYIDTHNEQEQAFLIAAICDYQTLIKNHFGFDKG